MSSWFYHVQENNHTDKHVYFRLTLSVLMVLIFIALISITGQASRYWN